MQNYKNLFKYSNYSNIFLYFCSEMRQSLSIILILSSFLWNFCIPTSYAAEHKTEVRYRLSAIGGGVNIPNVRSKNFIQPISDKLDWGMPIYGGEFAVEFLPTGRWKCLQDWNNASIGIAFDYLNFQQLNTSANKEAGRDLLGHGFAPYIFMNIPIVNVPHFVLGIRPGIGMAWTTKNYYNTITTDLATQTSLDKTANMSIGSYTNAYFYEALYMDFPIANGWNITFSGGWAHISNGSMKQPNSGYNMCNFELGASYHPHDNDYSAPTPNIPKHLFDGKRWDLEISASGGARQEYFLDTKHFGVASASLSCHYRLWSIFKIGIGVDAFYDSYYVYADSRFGKTLITGDNPENCFRVGISIQPEFVVGKFSTGFYFGAYMYDPVKNYQPKKDAIQDKPVFYSYKISDIGNALDGWCYTRILMKYRVTNHLFVQLGMKAHLTKAEFIDAGLGLRFFDEK